MTNNIKKTNLNTLFILYKIIESIRIKATKVLVRKYKSNPELLLPSLIVKSKNQVGLSLVRSKLSLFLQSGT